jgi:hypothetical protein
MAKKGSICEAFIAADFGSESRHFVGVEAGGADAAAISAADGNDGSEAGVAALAAPMALAVGVGGCGLLFFGQPLNNASAARHATQAM